MDTEGDQITSRKQQVNLKNRYPSKFAPLNIIFSKIHRGDRIFVGTACAEPQYLVRSLIDYVDNNPKAIFDAEVIHVWTLGVAPYTQGKFKRNFRHNSFFVGDNTRNAVNTGLADYTPIFLSQVPDLFQREVVPIDVALIQTSFPDRHGYMSLGISVDIVKTAVEKAKLVIVQVNSRMPRTHGDGHVHISDVDFIIHQDEDILEYDAGGDSDIAQKIGSYVSRLIQNGDTIQVGYGSIPDAILSNLGDKKDLGVHTELLSDGIVDLMKKGVINNFQKTINRGISVATFCMGSRDTYDYVDDNPSIKFHTVDYTNDPLVIARHENMTAINSALEVDLTGQATAESIGKTFYSGIGGQADFMRGAILAKNGKTILTLRSTAEDGGVSRIVPFLQEGAGVTLNRGDIHYVVTEFGIAYLHGKNIRERAMALISISHPKFRPQLIKEAKKSGIIYRDQAFIPGKRGQYPEDIETHRALADGTQMLIRPIKISDEPLIKDMFYSLSDKSMYTRFISPRKDMPHERLQEFVVIDYTKEMVLLAVVEEEEKEIVVGLAQYGLIPGTHTAEAAFVVRDDYQNLGIGSKLMAYLTYLAKKQGLLGFTAEVLVQNRPMLRLFEKMGFDIEKHSEYGVYELKALFKEMQ